MSNALAIAAVSAVIKNLLENGLIQQGIASSIGDAPLITLLAPELENGGSGAQVKDRLNLFLYQTTPNPGWRNVGSPSRNSRGEDLTNPPLAVDLHYLLTAYSPEAFHAEIMLGYAMQLLHEIPVLTREAIRTVLRNLVSSENAAERALATVDLADQVEQIKITPQTMNTEEISKLWSALQTPYRPTAVYQVSVVLIIGQRSTKSALPVRDRKLIALPFQRPQIAAVFPQVLLAGQTLTLQGQNLNADSVRVNFGTVPAIAPNPSAIKATQIQVQLPPGLQAGVNTVQVAHLLDFQTGSPSEPHRGVESNVVAFMLAPRITTMPTFPLAVVQVAQGETLTLDLDPAIGRNQRVIVLLGDRAIPLPPRPATDPDTTTTLRVSIPAAFPKGIYLLRVRVDGAESPLEVDQAPSSPTFNQYIEPRIEIT
jgi:Pvc16 N-terminal domain/IPT/TIG domain